MDATFPARRSNFAARQPHLRRASKRRGDDRLVRQTMRLAQRYSKQPADPFLYLVTAGLVGFVVAMMIGPRPRD